MNSIWRLITQHTRIRVNVASYLRLPLQFTLGISFVPTVRAIDLSSKKIEIPEQKNLSHKHLIQQAASVSVNAASQLLTQTMVAVLDTTNSYKKALLQLMSVLEESQGNIVGISNEIDDSAIALRAAANDLKKQLLDLNSLMEYVEKVVLSTAEASYLIGAEFVSASLTERLFSYKAELEEKRREVALLESECLHLQKNIITDSK